MLITIIYVLVELQLYKNETVSCRITTSKCNIKQRNVCHIHYLNTKPLKDNKLFLSSTPISADGTRVWSEKIREQQYSGEVLAWSSSFKHRVEEPSGRGASTRQQDQPNAQKIVQYQSSTLGSLFNTYLNPISEKEQTMA